MQRGKPFEPGNRFGRGRPPGSRNKSRLRVSDILEEHGEALLRKALLEALQGDTGMLRTLVDRLLPRRRELPVKTGPLPMGSAEELAKCFALLGKKLSTGELTVGEAQGIATLIEGQRRVIETHDLEVQVRSLEQKQQKNTDSR